MNQLNKIFLLTVVACMVVCLGLTTTLDSVSGITRTKAFAADEEQKDPPPAEGEAAEGTEEKPPCPECPECPDPAKVVLRDLEEKKTEINKQQRILDQSRKQLEIISAQLEEKLANLKALQKQVQADMAAFQKKKNDQELERDAAHEAVIGRMVKIYAGMKPKDAAAIINKMNLEVAQEIFLRMREASASQILAYVDSEKAAKISERLAFKKH